MHGTLEKHETWHHGFEPFGREHQIREIGACDSSEDPSGWVRVGVSWPLLASQEPCKRPRPSARGRSAYLARQVTKMLLAPGVEGLSRRGVKSPIHSSEQARASGQDRISREGAGAEVSLMRNVAMAFDGQREGFLGVGALGRISDAVMSRLSFCRLRR